METEHQYSSTGMKLVFNGNILDDSKLVSSENLNDQNFIVVVAKKVTNQTKKKKEEPVKEQPKEQIKEEPKELPKEETKEVKETKEVPKETTSSTTDFVTGDKYKQIVAQFLEMGFEKEQIDKCMKVAYNNPERAAEYLMGGIPEGLEERVERQQRQNTQQKNTQQNTQQTSNSSQLKQVLQNFPQFNQIRATIQQNPNLLQPILSRIAQDQPDLMELIQQNPEEFARILNEPVQFPQQEQEQETQTQRRQQQQPGTIMVTPQEKEAIDRIISMGFEKMLVIQVFFACEKNEEATIDFLIQMMERESQQPEEKKEKKEEMDEGK